MYRALIFRHLLRHKLRTALTILGMAVAILAFLLLRGVVQAWYRGVDSASDNRLVTRNAISLTFFLPISYLPTLKQFPGIIGVTHMTWFGGVYIDQRNFFPRFAVGPRFFEIHPEFVLTEDELLNYQREKRAAVVGRRLAEKYGWRIGDQVPIKGNIFPGDWTFVVRGIYKGGKSSTDESLMLFHHDYLNEYLLKTIPRLANKVGTFILRLKDPDQSADLSRQVDREFQNSAAETLTETEKSFQLGFVAMTKALLTVIQAVSLIVILVILTVLANTMAMSVRERTIEYVVMKTLGFGSAHLGFLVLGESLVLAATGGLLGAVLSYPAGRIFTQAVGGLVDFTVPPATMSLGLGAALAVGLLAAVVPVIRVAGISIAEGLRRVG
ncbi:MAG: FtsX-like permease family protein [Thermodesulfobacteriota bacterium]